MIKNSYPRPQLKRDDWINLNGKWQFDFDDKNIGLKDKWYENHQFSKEINVPFTFETKLSGINDQSIHEAIWYERTFELPKEWNKEIKLNFGAVDYLTKVFINGKYVGKHIGGNVSFSFNITNFLTKDKFQKITIYVFDPAKEERIPRGKQTWTDKSHSIWYTRTTGIWQTVWLEHVDKSALKTIKITPDIDKGTINLLAKTNSYSNKVLNVKIYDSEQLIINDSYSIQDEVKKDIRVWHNEIFKTNLHGHGKVWSPESPFLYDMTLELYEDDILIDKVNSYFGMRKVHTEDGKVYLNNRPYYLKLVLDQGYYKDSLLTSPNDEALIKDIELAKKMGYNGARLHQKIEEERYLYYADKLGFLVWGEMPSTATYDESYHKDIINEWVNVIERDYNHPSLMAWVPLNESWGVPQINHDKGQQNYALSLYYLTKSLDPTRLVISNDGWELVTTDIFAFHNYSHGQIDELDKQKAYENNLLNLENILKSKPAGRNMYANGFKYEGEPVLLTEFGGISFNKDNNNGWGYTNVNTQENFIKEYERLLNAINKSEVIAGFCYTQLTDVEQEVNGLLNYDRSLKVDLNIIKNINDKVNFK